MSDIRLLHCMLGTKRTSLRMVISEWLNWVGGRAFGYGGQITLPAYNFQGTSLKERGAGEG